MLTLSNALRARSVYLSCAAVLTTFLISCSTNSMQTKPTTLRVMTYNIHHGEGLDG